MIGICQEVVKILILTIVEHFSGIGVPRGYITWDDAMMEFVNTRGDHTMTPDLAPVNVWNTFEVLATIVIPKIVG